MKKLIASALLAALAAFPAFAAGTEDAPAAAEPQYLTAVTYDTTDPALIARARAELAANPDFAERYPWAANWALPMAETWAKGEPQTWDGLVQSFVEGVNLGEDHAHGQARLVAYWHPRFFRFWPAAVGELRTGAFPAPTDINLTARRGNGKPELDAALAWEVLAARFSSGLIWDWTVPVDGGIDSLLGLAAELNRDDAEVAAVLRKLNRHLSLRMIRDRDKWEPLVVKVRTLLETY